MKKLFLLLSLAVAPLAQAQQLIINSTHYIGGYGSDIYLERIAGISYNPVDKSIVFCGTADSCGSGDLVPKPPYLGGARGRTNVILGKIDSNRNLQWIKMYGSTNAGSGSVALVPLADGGYAIAGGASGSGGDVSGNHGGGDFWLLRTDSAGNKLWARCFGGTGNESAIDVKQTSDGGFITIGCTLSPVGGDVPFRFVNSPFAYDWLVVKTDSLGNKEWSKTIGGTDDEQQAVDIFQVGKDYFITGRSWSRDFHSVGNAWSSSGTSNYLLIKLDSAGNFISSKGFGSTGPEEYASAIWDSRDSTFVMTGFCGSGGNHVPPNSFRGQRFWVVKIDTAGNVRWSKVFGDTMLLGRNIQHITPISHQRGYAIVTELDIRFAPTFPSGYFGNIDVQVLLLDSAGNQIGEKKMGGPGYEFRPLISEYKGGFLVAGTTNSANLNEGSQVGSLKGGIDLYFSYLEYWPAGIGDQPGKKPTPDLTVFPNPATGIVTVLVNVEGKGTLAVIGQDGKLLRQQGMASHERSVTFNAASWARGAYTVKWSGEKGGSSQSQLILR